MNTFFEKLTNSKPQPVAADIGAEERDDEAAVVEKEVTPSQPSPKRAPMRKIAAPVQLKPKPTQLKVESEEAESTAGEKEKELEEEGELTVDIYDNGNAIVIQSTVAGVKPENLDVSITTDTVTIRGRREKSEEIKEEHYYYKELFWGSFSRSVILPEEIDDTAAEAALKHGLLTITLPKKRKGVAQKLKVKVT
ncbi:MAG: Hsp20/alpha crystallin family protein [Candidatus Sungbacteria bacterium]|nr:Hsp20/alpha crystallin family protein [Candidatus Sungbacteria bacterium]